MSFTATGDKHTNCGNGTCRLIYVKIYRNKKLRKTIKGTSNIVKPGDGVILYSSSCCYTNKNIYKDYSVGKKKIKVIAKFAFMQPPEACWRGGMSLFPKVNF